MPRFSTKPSKVSYVVYYTTCVDGPEQRDSTYPVVPKGHLIPSEVACHSLRAAISWIQAILDGEYDFESEYVTRVSAYRVGGKRRACVRREIRRDRPFAGAEL